MNAFDQDEYGDERITIPGNHRIEGWKWVVGVVAALAAIPFILMALGITVVLLAPFAIPALPIIAVTLFSQEKPSLVPIGIERRRARLAHADAH